MASSLTSSFSSTTVSSASIRRSSLVPTHHRPNSVSLPKPTRSFRSVRAQAVPESVEKAGEEIKEIHEKNVEKIGEEAEKAGDNAEAAKDEITEVAEDVADKTAKKVGDVWDAATGKK